MSYAIILTPKGTLTSQYCGQFKNQARIDKAAAQVLGEDYMLLGTVTNPRLGSLMLDGRFAIYAEYGSCEPENPYWPALYERAPRQCWLYDVNSRVNGRLAFIPVKS